MGTLREVRRVCWGNFTTFFYLAEGCSAAVVARAEAGIWLALNVTPVVSRFAIKTDFSRRTTQHGLLAIFDVVVVAHHESASLFLSRHNLVLRSQNVKFIIPFTIQTNTSFCNIHYKTRFYYENLLKASDS